MEITRVDDARKRELRAIRQAELQRLPLGVNRVLLRAFSISMEDPTAALWGPWLAAAFPFPQDPQVIRRIRKEVLASSGME